MGIPAQRGLFPSGGGGGGGGVFFFFFSGLSLYARRFLIRSKGESSGAVGISRISRDLISPNKIHNLELREIVQAV